MALEEYTRERCRWLGERESHTETLQQAVDAYELALEERTRERVPLGWAMTQNNLGLVLQTIGERESHTETLQQAVEAYRLALEEYTRERVPLDWAQTQMNLGNTLILVGEWSQDCRALQQAFESMTLAREVYIDEAKQEQFRDYFDNTLADIQQKIDSLS